jgi:pyrroline-5-carboxylate reductase
MLLNALGGDKMTRVSVIGCGNMGGAFLRGLARSDAYHLTAIDLDPDALETVEEHADETATDTAAAGDADVVILAVKPSVVEAVLAELDLTADQTLVTLAAGVSRAFVAERTDAVGEFVEVDEALMDISTAVNGSGPAFVFYLIDAMKQAGIDGGLDADQAETLAAQTFKGAAETVLRDERSVDELVDAVCSPNGTTIEGMEVLWDSDADRAVTDAVAAAEERSRELAEAFDDE